MLWIHACGLCDRLIRKAPFEELFCFQSWRYEYIVYAHWSCMKKRQVVGAVIEYKYTKVQIMSAGAVDTRMN
jgi:hypothetical protein